MFQWKSLSSAAFWCFWQTRQSQLEKKSFKAHQKLTSASAMSPFISHMYNILPYSCIMVNPANTWNKYKTTEPMKNHVSIRYLLWFSIDQKLYVSWWIKDKVNDVTQKMYVLMSTAAFSIPSLTSPSIVRRMLPAFKSLWMIWLSWR